MIRIKVRDVTGSSTLAGKSAGLRDFPKFMAAVEDTPEGGTIVLDWGEIEIATASYFATTFVQLLRMSVAGELDRYFVVAGLNRTCLDELKLILDLQGLVTLLANAGKGGTNEAMQVLGKLEPPYSETLVAVQRMQAASASELFSQHVRAHRKIGKTAWINRLTNLHRLRLVRKRKLGREYVFQALSKES